MKSFYYNAELAKAITACGQQQLTELINKINEYGIKL